MKFLPGTDPAIIQEHLDKWNKNIQIAPIKPSQVRDPLKHHVGGPIERLPIRTTPSPIKEKPQHEAPLTNWLVSNVGGEKAWAGNVDNVRQGIVDLEKQSIIPKDNTLRIAKSFIPGANAAGVRMARSDASITGDSLTGTDQFKQQRTGEGLTPREPRQGLNLDTPPRGPDQQIPNVGVGTGERWSGRGPENIQAEAEAGMIAKKKAMEEALLAVKKQQNLLINKR